MRSRGPISLSVAEAEALLRFFDICYRFDFHCMKIKRPFMQKVCRKLNDQLYGLQKTKALKKYEDRANAP